MSLAAALRKHRHRVELSSHATVGVRKQLRAFLRERGPFDVVDSPASLVLPRADHGPAAWVCRSTQPDFLYALAAFRGRKADSPVKALKKAGFAAWTGVFAARTYQSWTWSEIVMCHTTAECRRIGRW